MKSWHRPSLILSLLLLGASFSFASSSQKPIKAIRVHARVVEKKGDPGAIFDRLTEDLKKNLAEEKNPQRRFDLLNEYSASLSRLTDGDARPADEEKALEMALVGETFEGFPASKKEMDSTKCKASVEKAKVRMQTRTLGEQEDSGVTTGLEILGLVCGS